MNKIQKHFELNFWKDEMVSEIQIRNGKRYRIEKLTEYYTIKEFKDYVLTYNVSDKTYGIHTYDKSNERFIVICFKSQKDVIEYLNTAIKDKEVL